MGRIVKLLKRAPKRHGNKTRPLVYDLCVVRKSSHGKFVYEKIGCYSCEQNIFSINIFRLIFWISRGVSFTGGAASVLFSHNIFQHHI